MTTKAAKAYGPVLRPHEAFKEYGGEPVVCWYHNYYDVWRVHDIELSRTLFYAKTVRLNDVSPRYDFRLPGLCMQGLLARHGLTLAKARALGVRGARRVILNRFTERIPIYEDGGNEYTGSKHATLHGATLVVCERFKHARDRNVRTKNH